MNTIMITIILTLIIYWIIGFIISQINEDLAIYWAVGFIYPIAYVLFYPVRLWEQYTMSKKYYQRHGISRWQFMFGKRPSLPKSDKKGEINELNIS